MTVADCAPKKVVIELVLVDEDGDYVPNQPFEITVTGLDAPVSGTLDQWGRAEVEIEGVDPGPCKVCFTELDQDAWEEL
jgi:hypothetical protein